MIIAINQYLTQMIQETLLQQLKAALPPHTSLIDAVAQVLDISYDAAHRRTSMKSKLSIAESVALAQHFNLSLDKLFATTAIDYVTVEKTKGITNEDDLKTYFETSHTSLSALLHAQESQLIYSAKDIPIFYALTGDMMTRFKLYVWLKLLDINFGSRSFSQYTPQLDVLTAAKNLGKLYHDLECIEIWDLTTINSTLKQVHFYFQAGQLSREDALSLCDSLKHLINQISNKLVENSGYQLYHNELLLMNNNVFIKTPRQQSLFVPFTALSYYLTSDQYTCNQAKSYLDKQLQHSKLLNAVGEKERLTFFNKLYQKIDALEQLITATTLLDFQ